MRSKPTIDGTNATAIRAEGVFETTTDGMTLYDECDRAADAIGAKQTKPNEERPNGEPAGIESIPRDTMAEPVTGGSQEETTNKL